MEQAQILAANFDPEKAEKFADKHIDKQWYNDFKMLYNIVTDKDFTLDTSVYLAIAGAYTGVALGSVVPVVGTAIGVGAALGSFTGGIGLSSMFS